MAYFRAIARALVSSDEEDVDGAERGANRNAARQAVAAGNAPVAGEETNAPRIGTRAIYFLLPDEMERMYSRGGEGVSISIIFTISCIFFRKLRI